jgi:DGQHR domain-containing protein
MKIPAMQVRQGKYVFYVASVPLRFFDKHNEKLNVDIFQAASKAGYQRRPTEYRAKDFARYVAVAKGICPTAVLLNVRDEGVGFEAIRKDEDFGHLSLPDDVVLWIVDGQHRIKGFQEAMDEHADRMAELGVFKVPVVIMNLPAAYEEAKQFLIINKTQKGVKPDLAERFISTMARTESIQDLRNLPRETTREIEWRPKATEIVDIMNGSNSDEFEGNPWYQMIQLPNEPRGVTLVSQKAFEDSLKPVLHSDTLRGYSTRELATILVRYWKAIASLCEGAFVVPREYVIQKTTGIQVFHLLLPQVANMAGKNGKLTQTAFVGVLKNLDEGITDNYWSSNGTAGVVGTSRKSTALLVSQLSQALEGAENEGVTAKPFAL